MLDDLFSSEGRYGRAKYLGMLIGLNIAILFISIMVGAVLGAITRSDSVGGIVAIGVSLLGTVPIAFQTVKRLHDLDRPGTHYWLLFLPIYNLYLAVILLFKRGTEGHNAYGEDPLVPYYIKNLITQISHKTIVERLKELQQMKEASLLTDEEFTRLKINTLKAP
ncbi:MAG: DUF805 domain-containing protein [Caldilineaceae bacterium]